eukprot:1021196_1
MATKHFIVSRTGQVDNEYYPIWNDVNVKREDSMDLDVIENDEETYAFNAEHEHWHKPYFMPETIADDDTQLWVKGSTVSTRQKADNTILWDINKELQIGDRIAFERNAKPSYRSRCTWYPYGWRHSMAVHKGSGAVIKIHSDRKSCDVCMDIDDTTLPSAIGYEPDEMRPFHLFLADFNICRPESRTQLFRIHSQSVQQAMARFLGRVLNDTPWIILTEISSFLDHDYKRNIYFDSKMFEQMVWNQHFDEHEDHEDHWLGPDQIYKQQIYALSHRNHQVFPNNKRRQETYAKKPYLPQIPIEHRMRLHTFDERVSMALKPDTKLYKYQKHTTLWCDYIERQIAMGSKLSIGSDDLRFTKCKVFALNPDKYLPASPAIPRVLPPRLLTFKGGVVADDVGLGKSLTMLSLIVSNPFNGDLASTSFINEKHTVGPGGETLVCAATLIIAPSHLIQQWRNELAKHFSIKVNIIMIATHADHRSVTYRDMLNAQIVLVSAQFFAAPMYHCLRDSTGQRNLMQRHWMYLHPDLPPKPPNQPTKIRTRRAKKYLDLDQCNPFFELLYFHRIILDEGHDILSNLKMRSVIMDIDSRFCWYVSGTPFPTNESIGYAADFLDIQFDGSFYDYVDWNEQLNRPLGWVLHCILYYHLFSRHTKQSILDDNYLPDISEAVQMVQLHPIERLFYQIVKSRRGTRYQDKRLERRICSGVLERFERGKYNANHNECDGYLQALWNINRGYYPHTIKRIKIEIREEKKQLHLHEKWQIELREFKDKWQNKRENVQKEFKLAEVFATAPVKRERYSRLEQKIKGCMNNITRYEKDLIQYGHENKMIQNANISQNIQRYESEFSSKTNGEYLLGIVQTLGSKQAFIIQYIESLYKDESNHVIIFSIFAKALDSIKEQLSVINIPVVSCRGNVYIRRKAMLAFQSDEMKSDARIILLSTESAASGADLTKASHVILIDPVPGSGSESFAAERQAVGRAVRQGMSANGRATKVLRFVASDTIEHETHIRNEEMRQKLKEHGEGNDCDGFKYLRLKRTKDEIEFYMKINDVICNEQSDCDKENVNNINKPKNKSSRKRRKCECDDEDEDIQDSSDDHETEPKKKKRKISDFEPSLLIK